MAGLADIGGINMCCTLADCGGAVMTANARRRRGAVIKHHTQPGGGDMAHVAGSRRRNMCGGQTRGNHTIMTGGTGAVDFIVIHQRVHGGPRRGSVAGVAIV